MYIGVEQKPVKIVHHIFKFADDDTGEIYNLTLTDADVETVKQYLKGGRKKHAFDFVMRCTSAYGKDAMTIVEIFESQVVATEIDKLTNQEIDEIKYLIRKGQKLMAVKYILKQIDGIGLRDAKNIVDRYSAIVEIEGKNDDYKF